MGTTAISGLILAAWACGCANDAGAEVRDPTAFNTAAPLCVCAPAREATFGATEPDDGDDGYSDAYHSRRPPSINLGYIGDAPIGLGPQPQHHIQEWEKPFRLGGTWSRGWR